MSRSRPPVTSTWRPPLTITPLTPLFRLDSFDLVVCKGNDAEAFLQAQLSNDVRELGVANAQWNALISPQGRVQALIVLIRVDAQQFVLAIPHRRGATLLELLRRFVLRRKLQLAIDETRCLYGSDGAIDVDGLLRLDLSLGDERSLYLGSVDHSVGLMPLSWALRDLSAGIPWLPAAAAERHLPHSLRLDTLPAISLKKGCYPGQEIVARTHYLGRNKRALSVLKAAAQEPAIGAGAQLRDGENQLVGELLDALIDADGTLALAVITKERTNSDLVVELENGLRVAFQVVKQF